MAEREMCGSEFEAWRGSLRRAFCSGGEASEVFDAIEEPFDTIARPVEYRLKQGFQRKCTIGGILGRGTGGFDLAAQPVRMVGLVRKYDGAFMQVSEQALGDRAVTRLAGVRISSSGRPLASTRA
jgi:hypothetical protein